MCENRCRSKNKTNEIWILKAEIKVKNVKFSLKKLNLILKQWNSD